MDALDELAAEVFRERDHGKDWKEANSQVYWRASRESIRTGAASITSHETARPIRTPQLFGAIAPLFWRFSRALANLRFQR